jgi:hypothetical protein
MRVTKHPEWRQRMVDAVKKHALANYEQGGWDIVVECWTDDQIDEEIGLARSNATAIKRVGAAVGAVDSYRADIIAAGV